MRKKIIIGSILFFILLFTHYITANAQIASQSTQVNSGEQFSITVISDISLSAYTIQASYPGLELVNSSGGTGAGTATISNALASGGTTNLATFTFRAPTVSTDTQYTITFSGSGMGDENLNPVANSQSTSTITVKAPSNSGNTGGGTTSKSTEDRLSNLGFNPNDFSGFRRDTTTYTVEVPNNVSQVRIYATPVDSKATVSGTGTVNLDEGTNTFNITVTAEAGNTRTYTLNIVRVSTTDDTEDSENEASEARLSNLGIRPEEYDFSGFQRDTTSYSVEVPNNVTEVEVYAEPVSSSAQVTGTGTVALNEGINTIEIKVTAEDGTEMTYTLEVTRLASTEEEEPETTESLSLSSLVIKNFNLSPDFDPETYEYTIGLREDIDSLEIEAKANNSNATVEIVGNENLKDGENIITILVSNAETEEYATYQIIVNKNAESEIAGTVDWTNPSTWGLKEKIIIGVAILLVIVIIVAIIIKVKLAKKEDEDLDLPGAEELDRALAEHQELSDETEMENDVAEYTESNNQYDDYHINNVEEEKTKSDIEKAQEYFESYTKRKGKHF